MMEERQEKKEVEEREKKLEGKESDGVVGKECGSGRGSEERVGCEEEWRVEVGLTGKWVGIEWRWQGKRV